MNREFTKIAKRFGCNLIYLFGSQADTGKRYLEGEAVFPQEGADIDIAASFEVLPENAIEVYGELYAEFSKLFEPFELDLVFIHEVDTFFRYEIVKGIKVYEKNIDLADELEEDVLKRAGDLYFKKNIFEQEVMEAVKDGYFHFEYSPHS